MKPYSVSKFTSIVSILIFSLVGMQAGAEVSGKEYKEGVIAGKLSDAIATCRAAAAEVGTAVEKANSACISAIKKKPITQRGTMSCGEVVEECEEANIVELPFGLNPNTFGLTSGIGDDCRALDEMTQSEFRSEKREARTTVEEAEKDVEELIKDQAKLKKEHAELTKDIQKSTQDLLDEVNEANKEEKETKRKTEAENLATGASISKQIRETENRIMEIQKLQMKLPADRAVQVHDYQAKLLQCDLDIRIEAAKMKGDKYISNSLSRASMGGSSRGRMLSDKYDNCVQRVLSQRTADFEVHKANVAQLDKALTDTQAELNEARQARDLFEKQKLQATDDHEANKLADSRANLAKYQELTRQQQEADKLQSQEMMNNAQSFAKASSKVTRESNELDKFLKSPRPGTKTLSEANAAIEAINSAKSKCSNLCGGECPVDENGNASSSGMMKAARELKQQVAN